MGICTGICNTNLSKLKGDIIIKSNFEQETGKYLEENDMKKVIFLQRYIKKFLKKRKSQKKIKLKIKQIIVIKKMKMK